MKEYVLTILQFLMDLGPVGISLGLMIEIIPSEIVLAFAGFMVDQGKVSFTGAVIAGTIGGIFAQLFLYWAGRYGGRPFLLKYGKYVFIHEKHITMAENWFEKYGIGVVFFARFIPVVRHAISIPAGLTKMNAWVFTLYTGLAAIPWSVFFIYLGTRLGSNWDGIKEYAAPYVSYITFGTLLLAGLYIGFKYLKHKKQKAK